MSVPFSGQPGFITPSYSSLDLHSTTSRQQCGLDLHHGFYCMHNCHTTAVLRRESLVVSEQDTLIHGFYQKTTIEFAADPCVGFGASRWTAPASDFYPAGK